MYKEPEFSIAEQEMLPPERVTQLMQSQQELQDEAERVLEEFESCGNC